MRYGDLVHKAFHPDKVNYGAYGDGGCHLHFHLVPKYQGEFEWGTPFAMNPGKTSDGKIVLADEISPDTCRFWDIKTHEKLDKDRFRRDLGGVEDAYAEMMKRTGLN